MEYIVDRRLMLADQGPLKCMAALEAMRAKRDVLLAWARDEDFLPGGPAGLLVATRVGGGSDAYAVAEVLGERGPPSDVSQREVQLRGPPTWRPLERWMKIECVSNQELGGAELLAAWR